MAYLNKVQIIGNLGADPKISQTQGGVLIANFNVGCTEKYKDSQGVQQSKTEWVRVVLFNGTADVAQKYLHKGSLVYVEGKLQTRSYKDNQGIDRYVTEVIGSTMQMLGGKPEQAQNQPAPAPQTTYAQAPHTNYAQPVQPAYTQPVQQSPYAQTQPQTSYAQAPQTTYQQPVQPAPVAPQQPAYTQPVQSPYTQTQPQTTYAQAPQTSYAQPVQSAPVAPQQPATAPQQSPYVLPPQQEQQGNFGETDPLDDIPF